jgi:D-alanine transaminase/branched-chain amino acid aminotransferase
MMKPVCYAGKEFLPIDRASLSILDLGVQRGYGIFDFLRVSRNVPLFLEDHLDRFYHSAAVMRLSIPESRQGIRDILFHLIRENNLQTSGIRLILTGGASPDGYQIIEPALSIVQQVIQSPADELAMQGIHLLTYPFQRQLPQAKTTDYLMAIWLQPWLKKNGGDDILYHQSGMISECPRSNIFIVTKQGTLATPVSNMLKGITRKQVLTLAGMSGISVEERDISLDDIKTAQEAFITSSTKRIVPVRQVDNIHLPPLEQASVTRRLWENFLELERRLTSAG